MREIDSILEALRELSKSKTDVELAEKLGITYGNLDNWKSRDSIPDKRLRKFAEMFGVSFDALKVGEIKTLSQILSNDETQTYQVRKITSYKASAGGGNEIDGIEVYDTDDVMHIDRAFFKTPPSKKARAIKVDGYSMTPMLLPDSWVVFEECFDFKGDGLYVINYSGQLMVKLLQLTPQGVLKVISKNSDYQSYEIDLKESNEHFMIVGKVIKCII